jgi:hypothetical protein
MSTELLDRFYDEVEVGDRATSGATRDTRPC